ncbi:hypothetical protein EPUS_05869 [Endocarpon pusillum Z07020]|uniref:RNA-dependent RNA polymerase n=1 Tax=Endocarpon pusillum (strain Z07020 / HMAS-L-300199) TaxID=1263415 RepID=U1GWY1_ENDPU|nr:uncharacterized protein EPUS_05869 [Endocarpon pusillum Z07020]ERF76596.1 hypothetical protein EPUS_05869 [Endocarpon pusillum Z07020]
MEVFVRGVPERATERQVSAFFLPILTNLSIENWQCQKKGRKPFATLTFLSSKDGQRFLSWYGQARIGLGGADRMFQGKLLLCTRSNKPADPLALKSLEMDAKVRQTRTTKPAKDHTVSSLECSSVSCGLWEYIDSNLVFTSYLEWPVRGSVKFGAKVAVIRMDTGQSMDIPYSTIQAIATEGLPQPGMTLTLTEAPHFSQPVGKANGTTTGDLSDVLKTVLTFSPQSGPSKERLPGLNIEHEKIAGSCLVYRIGLVNSTLNEHMDALSHARGIPPTTRCHTRIHSPKGQYGAEMSRLRQALTEANTRLPFEVKFQVQKLAQSGYLSPNKVLALLPEVASLWSRSNIRVCVNAIRRLFQQLPFAGPNTDAVEFQLEAITSLLKENEERLKTGGLYFNDPKQSKNVAIIHRVTVTPAGTYLYGPEPESNNRVLRKYPEHHDYFIRVQFCDEDGIQVQYRPDVSNDLIFYKRFNKILDEGINIGGRQFKFLGFSHSSLRAQSCWFMAPFFHNGQLLHDRMLIAGLGDFSRIRCPAKCAARIGQAFSETPTAVTLAPGVAKEMKDVERNGRVFSDGVGTVSMSVLQQVWDALPSTNRTKPSLLQIRYSGAKGMIALDSRLVHDSLFLRKSMIKFPGSDSTDVEICGAAYKPLPLFLNQQSIKILEDMGVKDDFFLYHQAREVERLRSTTSSSTNASKFLKAQAVGEIIHLPWFINKLRSLNLSFQADKFLREVIEFTVLIELRALKYKARIPVKDGYTLYGIMDETGIIEEGQIFCIVESDGKPRVITGKDLMITRAPALHPGDIQLVTAVAVPNNSPLMKLRNCICFSQKGPRDLPSQLSGGDLDGDLYQIILDPKARPTKVFTPADYPAQAPVDLGRQVVRKDMTDFFVTFMATDQLGRIATLHKVLADQKQAGVSDPDCQLLAAMHSTAVDFSKSGIPVDMKKMPRYNSYRPDFMAPGPHIAVQKDKPLSFDARPETNDGDDDDFQPYKYYESDKILGKLYRAIDEQEVFNSVQQQAPLHVIEVGRTRGSVSPVLKGIRTYLQRRCQAVQWKHHLERARGIRDEYEDCLLNIASEYSSQPSRPLSELEVFVGNILGKTGAQSKKQHELSISMKERFNDDLGYIVNCIAKDGNERSEESLARSIACFEVGLEAEKKGLRAGGEFVSFKYVAAAVCMREVDKVLG